MIHLTLNTGHSRVSPRSEVSDETIAALRPVVTAGRGLIPGPAGYVLQRTRVRTCELFIVARLVEGGDTVPLVAGVIAKNAMDLIGAWRLACEVGNADIAMPLSAPWLAVYMYPTVASDPESLGWLGDLERCIAWAIMETA